MSVRTALQLINRVVDAYLNASDDELDADTLFCLNWFDQYGWSQGKFGQVEVLATAKGTTVERMKTSGVLESGQGNVRLLRYQEFQPNWHPDRDNRILVWEALHQLLRSLQQHGEQIAGNLLAGMPSLSEPIRNLAYRLYTLCEHKGWAEDARAYNELITSWDADRWNVGIIYSGMVWQVFRTFK
jgi:putative DNA methylase